MLILDICRQMWYRRFNMDETYTPPQKEQTEETSALQALRNTAKEHPVASVATVALLAGGLMGFSALNQAGGSEAGPRNVEIATNVFSIDVKEGALWRNDPRVVQGEDGSNIVMQVTIPGEVVAEARLSVVKDTNNGTWYGANPDWILDSTISQNLTPEQIDTLKSDKDGLVWVNQENISSVNLIDGQLPNGPALDDGAIPAPKTT